jgi:GMP synthase (glutamine-hydrolysing)
MSEPGTGRRRRRLLVVQPDASCALDRFGPWLADEGLAVRAIEAFAGDPIPEMLEEDALIVLGGDMSALDDAVHPWLEDIRRLYRWAVKHERPTLGICLGAQLLAQSLGGTVTLGDQGLEAGVVPVTLRPEASTDPLVGTLASPFASGGMHGDMIASLPPQAIWLGESAMYPHQIFRVGSAWGVQFHPELSPAGYRAWLPLMEHADPESLARARRGLAQFLDQDDEVAESTKRLARSFAGLVHAAALGIPG